MNTSINTIIRAVRRDYPQGILLLKIMIPVRSPSMKPLSIKKTQKALT